MHAPKVFGIGLSRTGTTKLAAVLRDLGLDTSDFVGELFDRDRDGHFVGRDWSVLDRHDAFTDSPVPLIYKELDRRCPGSKFILTTRGEEGWLASMRWMLTHGKIIWNYGPRIHAYHRDLYGTARFRRSILMSAWRSHHADVAAYFKGRERDILVMDTSGGFDAAVLCVFLGLPTVQAEAVDTERRVNERRRATPRQWARYVLNLARRAKRRLQ